MKIKIVSADQIAPQTASAGAPSGIFQPAYVRLPRPGTRCQFTGMTRTALYGLLKAGKVESRTVKQVGCKRGIRLISYQSLLAALEATAAS